MKRLLLLSFLALLLHGCKKKADETPTVDYSCDCSKYGKNIVNISIDHPLNLHPANNDRGNWGYINSTGSMVIDAKFKSLSLFSHDVAAIWLESSGLLRGGVISTSGNIIVQATHPYIGSFYSKEGLLAVGDFQDIWTYMDIKGTYKTQFTYSEAQQYYEGIAVVKYENEYGAIDINGTMLIPNTYEYLGVFSEGKAYFAHFLGWLGYINTRNEVIVPAEFSATGIFVNGYAAVRDTVYYKFGYINAAGNYLVPPSFDDANPFWEYLAAVKSGSKWGFIDTTGNMVIQPAFDDVLNGYNENMAGVKVGDQWGYADKSGNLVIQPQFRDEDIFYCGLAMVLFQDKHIGYIDKNGNTIWKSPIIAGKNMTGFTRLIDNYRNNFIEKAFASRVKKP